MPERHQQGPPRRLGLRWMAGAVSLAIAATAGLAILATAGPAGAAPTPTPSYHPGADPATFAVTGVLDGNCAVSTGGTEVWIKPGDKINFNSSVVGINLPVVINLVSILGGQVAGLNVTAVVDAGTPKAQTIKVTAGKTTIFANAAHLSGGNHTLTWTADSVVVLPKLALGGLGSGVTVNLSSNALKSGASLQWNGVIHVTTDTAQCKIAVGTPQVGVSVGPVKVTVPPINVGIPAPNLPSLPSLPSIPGAGGGNPPAGGGGNATSPGGGSGIHYTPPPLTVPEQAMGRVGTGGGFNGVTPDGNSASRIGVNLPQAPVANGGNAAAPTDAAGKAKVITNTLGLASNKAPAAQLPVLLALIAIIALSLVTATYARLYMLRRDI